MSRLLIICGPTATGKTDLGVFLGQKFNGEIISADSRQVYKGMDIGTGKDLPVNSKLKTQNSKLHIKNKTLDVGYRLRDGIPVWLVDIVDPDYPFNLGEYKKIAQTVIADIQKCNKLPIIVGGTGLYIKALTTNLFDTAIPRNTPLRIELEKLNVEELQKKLQKIDSNRISDMNQSDRRNPRRLIRAIEIEMWKRQSNAPQLPLNPSTSLRTGLRGGEEGLRIKQEDVLRVGLNAPRAVLSARIEKRIYQRIRQGLLKEIQSLLDKGYSWQLQSFSATGYQEWQDYFMPQNQKSKIKNQKSLLKIINTWKLHEEQYAKRQLTWFKKDKRIEWFDITSSDFRQRIEQTVRAWYT